MIKRMHEEAEHAIQMLELAIRVRVRVDPQRLRRGILDLQLLRTSYLLTAASCLAFGALNLIYNRDIHAYRATGKPTRS